MYDFEQFSKINPREKTKEICNFLYREVKDNHVGKDNAITGVELVAMLKKEKNINTTLNSVARAFHILRYKNVVGFNATSTGYYYDDSFEALKDYLRSLAERHMSIMSLAYLIRQHIVNKYGKDAIPEDLADFLAEFEDEDDDDDL